MKTRNKIHLGMFLAGLIAIPINQGVAILIFSLAILVALGRAVASLDDSRQQDIENTIKRTGMTPAEAALYRAQRETAHHARTSAYINMSR